MRLAGGVLVQRLGEVAVERRIEEAVAARGGPGGAPPDAGRVARAGGRGPTRRQYRSEQASHSVRFANGSDDTPLSGVVSGGHSGMTPAAPAAPASPSPRSHPDRHHRSSRRHRRDQRHRSSPPTPPATLRQRSPGGRRDRRHRETAGTASTAETDRHPRSRHPCRRRPGGPGCWSPLPPSRSCSPCRRPAVRDRERPGIGRRRCTAPRQSMLLRRISRMLSNLR